jgi:hypothetical protein
MRWSNDWLLGRILLNFYLGYTSIQYDRHRLVQGRPLSPIPISTIVQVYVDSFTNTVHQIIMKHWIVNTRTFTYWTILHVLIKINYELLLILFLKSLSNKKKRFCSLLILFFIWSYSSKYLLDPFNIEFR